MRRAGNALPNDLSLLRKGTVGVVALALGLALAGAASAADLYPKEPRPHAGSPYDDPRYAELYGPQDDDKRDYRRYRRHEPRAKYHDPRKTYDDYDDTEYDRDRDYPRSHKRDHAYNDGYADRDPWRDRRSYVDHKRYRKDYGLGAHCIPRRLVLRQLRHQGWYNFTDLELRGQKATVRADNRDGGHYHLVIQRCSGEVLWADRIDRRHRHSGWRSAYGPAAGHY